MDGESTDRARSYTGELVSFGGFYFVYFATLGVFAPYWGLYLQSLGLAAFQIGVLVGIKQVAKVLAPNVWGPLADWSGHRLNIARLTAGGTLLAFLPLYGLDTFWAMFPVVALFAFFHAGPLPLVEGAVWDALQERGGHYGRLRLWGSIGFLVTVIGLGPLFAGWGLVRLLDVLTALFVGIVLITFLLPEPGRTNVPSQHSRVWETVRQRPVWGFFATAFLMQASHGSYYAFFSILLADFGYSEVAIGLLWGLGVFTEIFIFLYTDELVRRWGIRTILLGSLALAALRWGVIGSTSVLGWLLMAQCLHAATFATFHAAAARHTHELFPGHQRSSGFALYSSLTFGCGITLGALLSGALWDSIGGQLTFWVAAGLALMGIGVMHWTQVARSTQPLLRESR